MPMEGVDVNPAPEVPAQAEVSGGGAAHLRRCLRASVHLHGAVAHA